MGETFWELVLGVRTFVESTEIPGRREKSSQSRRLVHKRKNKGVKNVHNRKSSQGRLFPENGN